MVLPSMQKLRIYLHLVPVLGVMPSLLHLYASKKSDSRSDTKISDMIRYDSEKYGERAGTIEDSIKDADAILESLLETSAFKANALESAQIKAASRLSVVLGSGCISAIALLMLAATTQASQVSSLRFLIASSFVGSGYFILCLALMFQVANNKSIRLPGISRLSRRLL